MQIKKDKIMKSSSLFNELTNPIQIQGNPQILNLFNIAKNATLELGNHEHSGDWDPYLRIELQNTDNVSADSGSNSDLDEILSGNILYSATGYDELDITDDIATIQCEDPNDDEKTIGVSFPISDIITINLER